MKRIITMMLILSAAGAQAMEHGQRYPNQMPVSLERQCAKKIAEVLISQDSMDALHANTDNDFIKDALSLPEGLQNAIRSYMPQQWAEHAVVKHDRYVLSVAFSPYGELLATGSNDNNARIIKAATGEELHKIEHGDWVRSVAFSPDSELFATGSYGNNAD